MNFTDGMLAAHEAILQFDTDAYLLGLGVSYPGGADGTTKGLGEKYPTRVLDVPVSELAVTGMAVGMAASGLRPIIHHGRVEFALLAADQIITQASKWNVMFGNNYPCPLVSRICVGRQWGNGPQHTSGLHSMFLQTTNLDIYIPATPEGAYLALMEASGSNDPSVILEHRWLYKTKEEFLPISKEELSRSSFDRNGVVYGLGNDFTILTYADGLLESLNAIIKISDAGINGEVICLERFRPDRSIPEGLLKIINEAKQLILFETSPFEFGVLSGLISRLPKNNANLKVLAPQFKSCGTSTLQTKNYYPNYFDIVGSINEIFDLKIKCEVPDFNYLNNAPAFDYSDEKILALNKRRI
ncbi:MAG: Acetoin:2,6-dichlorophenolindophenol oxidoreductase subunit beta [Bacteroidota bacterium]|jgi:pyruvate dehydrogenase E1 component beta subunit